jgi:hypothetical protein
MAEDDEAESEEGEERDNPPPLRGARNVPYLSGFRRGDFPTAPLWHDYDVARSFRPPNNRFLTVVMAALVAIVATAIITDREVNPAGDPIWGWPWW